MAVSKTQSAEAVRGGVRRRAPAVRREPGAGGGGEGRGLAGYPDLDWAMIGHLQTNKAGTWPGSPGSSTPWTRSRSPRR